MALSPARNGSGDLGDVVRWATMRDGGIRAENAIATRPAPVVTRVPPRTPRDADNESPITAFGLLIGGGGAFIAIIMLVATLIQGGPPFATVFGATVALIAGATCAACVFELRIRPDQLRKARQAFIDRHPDWANDPFAVALDDLGRPGQLPKQDEIRAALDWIGTARDAAQVVIMHGKPREGAAEVGDHRFEPEIITPTQQAGGARAALATGVPMLIGGSFLLPTTQWGWMLIQVGATTIGLWLVPWLYRAVIMPRYIRIAPGVVELITYRFVLRKPVVRSYPMVPGSVAVLSDQRLLLFRDEHDDALDLRFLHDRRAVHDLLMRALLSTAPTPPLSDRELLG